MVSEDVIGTFSIVRVLDHVSLVPLILEKVSMVVMDSYSREHRQLSATVGVFTSPGWFDSMPIRLFRLGD